jgi:hypothetical protein
MELLLPEQSRVHKGIPKSKFFEKALVNTKLKREFTEKIQKIFWEYKLSESTIGISKTDTVEEIQVFVIQLKEQTIPKNVLKLIDRSIPYPILYVFKYDTHTAYGITLKGGGEQRYYFSDWGAEMNFDFSGVNLEAVYKRIVKTFLGASENEQNFTELIENDKKRKTLEREIKAIVNKIKNERQFNKKVELNGILQSKKREIEPLLRI